MVWNNKINKMGRYGLKSLKTGNIVEKFRTLGAVNNMKYKYEKEMIEELEVVKI